MEETIPFLFLFSLLFCLILPSHARVSFDPSDHKAFIIIRDELGLTSENHHLAYPQKPCQNVGVICEKRISRHSSILKITHLVFDSRELYGSLSPSVAKLTELRELTLSNNHLSGQLPPQIVSCRKLEVVNLKNNRFSGQLPPDLSRLVRLRVLDISSNRFSGDLSFLRHFPNLETLSLSDNLFTGKVPASLRSFQKLKYFNITGNVHIQGPVPILKGEVEDMPSDEGAKSFVPRRYILANNSTNSSSAPSPKSSKKNDTAEAPSPTSTSHKHHRKHKVKEWTLGFLAGSVLGGIIGMFFSLIVRVLLVLAQKSKKQGPVIFSPLIKSAEDLAFLERDEGLANLVAIGRGGCGEVFKAELPGSNGKFIAIKKVTQPPRDASELADEESKRLDKKMRQIRAEIQTVGKIRHRNLLPLLAHVLRPDCHYLVYEFMKNGSLQDVYSEVSAGRRELNWLARSKIALGVAAGLEYLHFNNNPKIIHRDLKPANILLDDDMEPRISDFGLAKPIPDADTHVTSSNVVGTLGYIAPEYHQTHKFTDKCDMYSYGVILGTLVTGRLPSDPFFQSTPEQQLVKWMRNIMVSENPKGAVDEKLIGEGYEEQMLQVLKIACFCTIDDPKERPTSKEVRCMLSQLSSVHLVTTQPLDG